MTRVWLLYDRSKPIGIFLVLVFVSGLSIGLLVNRYSPGVSVPSVCVHVPLTFAHQLTERGPSGYTMCGFYLPIQDTCYIYVLLGLVPDSLTRCPRIKPGAIFWLFTIAIIVEVSVIQYLYWSSLLIRKPIGCRFYSFVMEGIYRMARICHVHPFHCCLDQAVSLAYIRWFDSKLIASVGVDCIIASFLVKKWIFIERNGNLTQSSRRSYPDDHLHCNP